MSWKESKKQYQWLIFCDLSVKKEDTTVSFYPRNECALYTARNFPMLFSNFAQYMWCKMWKYHGDCLTVCGLTTGLVTSWCSLMLDFLMIAHHTTVVLTHSTSQAKEMIHRYFLIPIYSKFVMLDFVFHYGANECLKLLVDNYTCGQCFVSISVWFDRDCPGDNRCRWWLKSASVCCIRCDSSCRGWIWRMTSGSCVWSGLY